MNKDQLIKYAMIAGAAYLVYWYLTRTPTTQAAGSGQNIQTGPHIATQAEIDAMNRGGQVAAPGTGTATSTGTVATGGTNAGFTKPSDEHLARAATNSAWAGEAAGYKMNVHQWNWYRTLYQTSVAGNANPDPNVYSPAMDDITDPNIGITAEDYHALLSRKGLSGLGWTPIVPQYLSRWTM